MFGLFRFHRHRRQRGWYPSRRRLWLGPFYWYYSLTPMRFYSWGLHLGLYTKNFTTGQSSFNIPGIGSRRW